MQALRDHAAATNPLMSIPSNFSSTTGDWQLATHFCRFQWLHGGSVKNTAVTDVDSLLHKLSREQKRMAQLNNAQLILLSHKPKKENECAARNSLSDVSRHRCQTGSGTRAQEQFQVAKLQFDGAIKEIERTQ